MSKPKVEPKKPEPKKKLTSIADLKKVAEQKGAKTGPYVANHKKGY